jgi:hypothetical protein
MASPFQKIAFYSSFMLIFVVLITATVIFSNDLKNGSNELVNLDNDSSDYIDSLTSIYDDTQFGEFSGTSSSNYSNDNIAFGDNESGVPQTDGFLATVQFAITFLPKILNILYLVYSGPVLLLIMLGLPITPFTFVSNIISAVIYLGLVALIVKFINIGGGD